MSLLDLERAVLAVCFGHEPSEAELAVLGDRSAWLLYRDMVRERLYGEIRVALPRSCKLLGHKAVEALLAEHLAGDPPRTRFFREVVLSFSRSSLPRLRADSDVPAFAADLMAYEAAAWEVRDLDGGVDCPVADVSFDKPLMLSPALRLLALDHAVHERSDEHGAFRSAPVWLCLHRATDVDAPRVWTLDAPTFAVLSACEQRTDEPLTGVLQRVAGEHGIVLDAAFVDRFCTSLTRFIEAGLVLGSA